MTSKYISFEDITLSFFDPSGVETIVYDDLKLDILRGKIYRLSGENGSGKSSLIKLIKGIYRPDLGRVTIAEGIKIFCPNFEELPMNLKVKDYLSFYSALTPAIISLLSLENLLKLRLDTLSTGEKQRIALAPIFVEEYDMLILDESFKYIDESKRKTITEAIEDRYFGKTTILFVEHEVDDLFDFTDALHIENKRITHTEHLVDRAVTPEVEKLAKKTHEKYWHLFKSHYLIYPLVFIFIAVLQLTPSLFFSSFFPVSHVRQIPVVTLKSRDGAISEDVLQKVEKYGEVKYSLEYTKNPIYYNYDKVNIDYSLKDDEVILVRTDNGINGGEIQGNMTSLSYIVCSRGMRENHVYCTDPDPILKIKKAIRIDLGKNESRNYVSKKNYIIMNQMINFFEKFSSFVTPYGDHNFVISFTSKYDSILTTVKNQDPNFDFPTQVTLVHTRENKDNIVIPSVTIEMDEPEPGAPQEMPSLEMNIDYLERFVADETYVSLVVNNKKEYEELKNVAIAHGLVVYTNFTDGYRYDPIKVTTNLAVWSLTIMANVTIFLYPFNLKRRKYELLIEGKLKGRDHLLILGTTFVTTVISIISIIITKNWVFPLINLAFYLALIAVYFYHSNKKGDKHAKI